jgi:TatD DNase family protein
VLVDTHCHIQEASYPHTIADVLARAQENGIQKMICVGTNEQNSREAIKIASQHHNLFASIGIHPHDTKDGWDSIANLVLQKPIAIGEIGLDYFYTHSPREVQIEALQSQIETALVYDLPIIFHVREAFDDFWPIFDNFHGIRGVLHSYTDTTLNLEQGLKRGLFIGVNGIATFTKDATQQAMFVSIPLEKLLFETDAPYLTPTPLRGTINEPAFVKNIAEFAAISRDISLEQISSATSANAHDLFGLQINI